MRVEGIDNDFLDCFECDAVWLSLDEFSEVPTETFMNFVRSFGLDPLSAEETIVNGEHTVD